jgi:hypothetical protein
MACWPCRPKRAPWSCQCGCWCVRYAHILEQPRGAGYWMWKPYVILKTLVERMDWGDYLCYVRSFWLLGPNQCKMARPV